ncbi:MAG: hypothetical protein LQ346_008589, partial [Caloplaca aetnensis]
MKKEPPGTQTRSLDDPLKSQTRLLAPSMAPHSPGTENMWKTLATIQESKGGAPYDA